MRLNNTLCVIIFSFLLTMPSLLQASCKEVYERYDEFTSWYHSHKHFEEGTRQQQMDYNLFGSALRGAMQEIGLSLIARSNGRDVDFDANTNGDTRNEETCMIVLDQMSHVVSKYGQGNE